MERGKYSKNEVIEIVAVKLQAEIINNQEKYKNDIELLEDLEVMGEGVDVSGKFEKRFANVINFLLKPDVRQVLGDPRGSEKSKQYFFSKHMSITRSDGLKVKNNAYQLNVIDMLFIAGLMLTYNNKSFTLLRKRKVVTLRPEALMDDWMNTFTRALHILSKLLEEDIKKDTSIPSIEVININLASLLQQLYSLMEKYNQGIYGDLAGIAAVFQALPEDLREQFYNEKLARPLKNIKRDLLLFIDGMKSNEDQKDYEEFVYNFDLEYDVHEYLVQLSDEPSMSQLFNLLENDFYDEENEVKEDTNTIK